MAERTKDGARNWTLGAENIYYLYGKKIWIFVVTFCAYKWFSGDFFLPPISPLKIYFVQSCIQQWKIFINLFCSLIVFIYLSTSKYLILILINITILLVVVNSNIIYWVVIHLYTRGGDPDKFEIFIFITKH